MNTSKEKVYNFPLILYLFIFLNEDTVLLAIHICDNYLG